MNFSSWIADAIIDHFFRNETVTSPVTVFVALHKADPGKSGAGDEVSGGGYVRQSITFTQPDDGETWNVADVVFPVAMAEWGEITHVALMTAETGGNRLVQGPLDSPKFIGVNDQFKFAVGKLKVILK